VEKENIINAPLVVADKDQENVLPTDPKPVIRFGLLILLFGFGGFLAWSFFADLDQGITSTGTVVVDSKKKVIQHSIGGIIESIHVKNGQAVTEGQVLMRLVSTQSQAGLDIQRHQAQMLKIQINDLRPLVKEGYYPRNQFMDLERQYKDALAKIKVSLEETERTEIKSPVAGNVMGLSTQTIGGVISPGGKIMEIVPQGDQLVIEAQIPPHLIDKIHSGLEADIHLTALNQRTTPILQGKVEWVSSDRFEDPARPEIAYFVARIQLTNQSEKILKSEALLPGMPADVVIKTGERTFWNYLTRPIVDRANLSMKER
jgi:protease secretion system membrane fusion protein